ncbi:uncharacterized protein LOC144446390 isoform X2 [Glandiceps talaboti]
MAEINNAALRDGIKEILDKGDMATLSSKRVRRMLEEKFSVDLTDRKQEIDKMIMSMITEAEAKESAKETDGEKATSSKETNETTNSVEDNNVDSDDSSSIGEIEDEPPKKKKKQTTKKETQKKPARVKATKSNKKKSAETVHDSDDSDEEPNQTLNDAELARQLQEEEDGGRRTRHRNAKRTATPQTTQKKRKKTERKGKSGYSADMVLSPELAEIMGTDRMPRHTVVKKMWEIIRQRELMDPKNKQFMLCDEQLLKVFGKKRVRMFGMMKYLKTHIKDPVYLTE